MYADHVAIVHDARQGRWLRFGAPQRILTAATVEEVMPALQRLDEATQDGGLYGAGFVAYEAAPAFDRALRVRPATTGFPLVWFGLYREPEIMESWDSVQSSSMPATPDAWAPSISEPDYHRAIARIKEYLRQGDTYQVNFSYRLTAPFTGDAGAFFAELARAQRSPYAAFVNTAPWAVCSASPELFFTLDGNTLTSRPMKGTAARGLTCEEDRRQAEDLRRSEKNRAENVMIVDMIRNDLGRVAVPGGVRVSEAFAVEKYPTVWQMTSTVTAQTDARLPDIFRALFPCASITGAPKPRTMEIIAELETAPRHIYTGCVGFVAPGRRAQFNVAIRTVLIDKIHGQAEYGVGGGILWDSSDADEFRECSTKARILTSPPPEFRLLETMLWTSGEGYFLLDRHLDRLTQSAGYFDFTVDAQSVREQLDALAKRLGNAPERVRLLLARAGAIALESAPLTPGDAAKRRRVFLARAPVNSQDAFLYHKTTNRRVYQEALAARSGYDDVLLWNEKGEVTESCIANVVVERDGRWVTPPARCGLLGGVYRGWMIDQGLVQEDVIRVDELPFCSRIFLINSVRKQEEVLVDLGMEGGVLR